MKTKIENDSPIKALLPQGEIKNEERFSEKNANLFINTKI